MQEVFTGQHAHLQAEENGRNACGVTLRVMRPGCARPRRARRIDSELPRALNARRGGHPCTTTPSTLSPWLTLVPPRPVFASYVWTIIYDLDIDQRHRCVASRVLHGQLRVGMFTGNIRHHNSAECTCPHPACNGAGQSLSHVSMDYIVARLVQFLVVAWLTQVWGAIIGCSSLATTAPGRSTRSCSRSGRVFALPPSGTCGAPRAGARPPLARSHPLPPGWPATSCMTAAVPCSATSYAFQRSLSARWACRLTGCVAARPSCRSGSRGPLAPPRRPLPDEIQAEEGD